MVEVKLQWNESNLKEYVKYTSFTQNTLSKAALIVFSICYVMIFAFCMIMAFAFNYYFMIGVALILTLLVGIFAVFMVLWLKSYIKNALKANSESDINNVLVCTDALLLLNEDEPLGKIDYENVKEIVFNEKNGASYIITKGDAVLILENKNIMLGTCEELKKILEEKKSELSKEVR